MVLATVPHLVPLEWDDWLALFETCGYYWVPLAPDQTDPLNHVTQYKRDVAGRVEAITDRLGHRREFTYDLADRMTQETWLAGATDPWRCVSAYC